jgi:L-threonylcarbamoyladenylate synthase
VTAPLERGTRLFTVTRDAIPASAIIEAARVLREGGLVAFPTETVYGLGANALDDDAVRAIFAAKERALDDPLIVHISDAPGLAGVARDVPPLAESLAAAFWPGPLSIVLERGPAISPAVSAGLSTVAVRVPAHPVAAALIREAGVPVAAPSANRFMRTSATTAAHVLEDLDGRIDIILDGGPSDAGIESTVVAVEGDTVRILRKGAITAEQIRAALPSASVESGLGGTAAAASPGLLGRHYSPRKPLTLFAARPGGGVGSLEREAQRVLAAGGRPGLLVTDEDAAVLSRLAGAVIARLGPEGDSEAIARVLFARMRELDAGPATELLAREVEADGLGAAINDRLRRAAVRVLSG